jgi:transcriptional regulator with XRE-family HTH domain
MSRKKVRRFGEKVRTLRLRHNMTMQKLAEHLQTSSAYISQVEHGQTESRISFALDVAQLFGISTDVLLNDELDLPES